MAPAAGLAWESPGIADDLFQHGFSIPLDPDVERMVNAAILNPGSDYAYDRTRMIILVPAERRIVFAYAG